MAATSCCSLVRSAFDCEKLGPRSGASPFRGLHSRRGLRLEALDSSARRSISVLWLAGDRLVEPRNLKLAVGQRLALLDHPRFQLRPRARLSTSASVVLRHQRARSSSITRSLSFSTRAARLVEIGAGGGVLLALAGQPIADFVGLALVDADAFPSAPRPARGGAVDSTPLAVRGGGSVRRDRRRVLAELGLLVGQHALGPRAARRS